MKSSTNIDPFFADAVRCVLEEKNGRSVTVVSLAGQIGFRNTTSIYMWLRGLSNIGRKTLQHKLKDDDPAGELARMVEKHYQIIDAKKRSKNMADCRQICKDFYSLPHGRVNLIKKIGNSWIESV